MAITKAYLPVLPKCSFHPDRDAAYDGPTTFGPWAYMCGDCWTGKSTRMMGTELIAGDEPARDRHAEAQAALDANDFSAFEDAVGDGDPLDFL